MAKTLPAKTVRKERLFMLNDGAIFEWREEVFTLIGCDEYYNAKVRDKLGNVTNFNACATVIVHYNG